MKLKPSTNYNLSEDDLSFALELAKVGSIHLLSSQISFSSNESNGITFSDWKSKEEECIGLKLPKNWAIEWIGFSNGLIKINFVIERLLSE